MTDKKNGVDTSTEVNEVEQEVPAGIPASGIHQDSWSISSAMSGRKILITGATGFLAKVLVSMILRYHPDVDQLYVVIRPRRTVTAAERFREELIENGTFDPLREIYGAGLDDFVQEKVTVIPGDITSRFLGMKEDEAKALSSTLDVFINSAGLTNFNPNLEHALEINTLSEYNIQEFIELGDYHCALQHISTCFVAGNTRDPSPERLPTPDFYPSVDDLGVDFDVDREIDDCQRMIAHAKELAKDQEQTSAFHRDALEKLKKRNLNPERDEYYQAAYREVRDAWIKNHLSYRGRDRAAHWGFPNIYTYTKSMGERLLAKNKGKINFAIVRPAIVESAMIYPEPGWNEGINTSAPLVYLRYKGHRTFPLSKENSLDIIPVDYVCGAMIAVAAALMVDRNEHDVYHLGTSDKNPLMMPRLLELTSLATRKLREAEVNTPGWQKLVLNAMEGEIVSEATFNARSAPGISKALKGFRSLIGNIPTKSLGGVGKVIRTIDKSAHGLQKATGTMGKMFEIFMPFIMYNKYKFIARNIDTIRFQLPEHEQDRYGSPVDDMDWFHYWIKVHVPGLNRHVFPNLEDKLRASNKKTYTYEDLVDLFDSSTANFSKNVALQHHDGQITERYTYEELGQYALRAKNVLEAYGVSTGTPVMLVSENRPQWAMTYFGILKAKAVAVPVDYDSADLKIARLADSCKARVIVLSDRVYAERLESIQSELEQVGHSCHVLRFSQLFTLALPPGEEIQNVIDMNDAGGIEANEDLASLIYTSGTTGQPKGVMLSHRNFVHLVNSMQQIFDKVNERDGFLSVLPLHHTFEFSAGLLMPISRGSTITYLEELNGDELTSALKNTKITALIGVPALWQLLFKRIDQRLNDAPPAVRWTIKQLLFLNKTLRQRARINIGPMLFSAIHRAFGGRIKYFISGAAALPADLLKAFYGMGFNMYEGYGLTEAAPVLTVNRPDKGLLPGSVGKALPGVEVEILNPDDEGVGEVVARGENVMLGYLGLDDETKRALQDGWLHTGDLGKLDEKGNLTIVGRAKDVIVTHGGKNVYPDELEELYGEHRAISELSVVGLDDGRGSERVAALVRPEIPEGATDEDIADLRAQIREWFRVEGSRVAAHERIQVIRFWEDELPRTATRKIRRTAVVDILERLISAEEKAHEGEGHDEKWLWLDRVIGNLCDYDAKDIYPSSRFQDDLGFDSLMVVELGSILEAKGYHLPGERLSNLHTVAELRDALEGRADVSMSLVRTKQGTLERVDEYAIPTFLAKFGKDLLYEAQMRSYGDFFDVEVYGKANIPHHDPNIIVAANHSSHLDMGLVKYALGDFGNSIRALAAADYFYKNKTRKTYFKNFTNLLPIERSGNLETSLGHAERSLRAGEMLLIFPEGTRSKNGKMQPFKKGIGYLVASQKVNVLPVFIEGTHRALPKGQSLPSIASRKLKVFIGKPLDAREMIAKAAEAPTTVDGYQIISDQIRESIVALRDRKKLRGKKTNGIELTPIFESLNAKFATSQVDAKVSFYFSLGDVDDHKWTVTVDPDKCNVVMGKPQNGKADCVVKTSPEIFRKMIEESYIPSFDEFMNGTIKTNDPNLLMRFQAVFQLF